MSVVMQLPPKSPKTPVVFVSHSAQDGWVAQRIAEAIRGQGAEAFLAEDLDAGEDFPTAIRSAMLGATELLVYLTPWAIERPWVWLEMGAAWARGLLIVCMLHGVTADELRKDSRFPLAILTTNFIDINELDSAYEQQLRRRVQQAYGR